MSRTDGRRKVTLGEVADVSWGDTSTTKSSYTDTGFPAYSASGQDGYLPYADFDRLGVILSAIGANCGKTWLAKGQWSCIKNTIRFWSTDAEADTEFLYWKTRNPQIWPKRGSAQPFISQGDARALQLELPPLPEQRAIAHILGTLDDKIELNRRMNQTLEEMARALFKSWFVDFDPVRAKAALKQHTLPSDGPAAVAACNSQDSEWTIERARAYLDAMDPQIVDLFADGLVSSELGETPEGWEVKALLDCISVERGLSYKGSGLSANGMPMHNLNSIHEGGGYKDEGIKYYKGDYQQRHITEPDELLVANTEQGHDRLLIGFAAIVPSRHGSRGLFSHHLYRIRPILNVGLSSDYLCQMLNARTFHETVSGYATGTTVNMLPTDALRIPQIVVPPSRLVAEFSTIAQMARTRKERLTLECSTLSDQRDSLLPHLMSSKN